MFTVSSVCFVRRKPTYKNQAAFQVRTHRGRGDLHVLRQNLCERFCLWLVLPEEPPKLSFPQSSSHNSVNQRHTEILGGHGGRTKHPRLFFAALRTALCWKHWPRGALSEITQGGTCHLTCLLSLQVGLPWLLQPVSGAGQEERARQHRQEGHLQVRPGEPHQGELAHPGRPGLWERLDQNALSLGQGGVNCPFWSSSLLKLSEMLIRSPTSMTVKEKPLHVSRVPPSLFHISVHIENEIICTAHWGLGWGPSWLQAAGPRSPASP